MSLAMVSMVFKQRQLQKYSSSLNLKKLLETFDNFDLDFRIDFESLSPNILCKYSDPSNINVNDSSLLNSTVWKNKTNK